MVLVSPLHSLCLIIAYFLSTHATPSSIEVPTCCGAGTVLQLSNWRGELWTPLGWEGYQAECVQTNDTTRHNLDGSLVTVSDLSEEKELKSKGVLLPDCSPQLIVHKIPVTKPDTRDSNTNCFKYNTSFTAKKHGLQDLIGEYQESWITKSADECQAICKKQKQCNFFSWSDLQEPRGSSYNCRIMWNKEFGEERCKVGGCVSGPKYCMGQLEPEQNSTQNSCIRRNVRYVGQELKGLRYWRLRDWSMNHLWCQELCEVHANCKYYSFSDYKLGQTDCKLYSRLSSAKFHEYTVSGAKYCEDKEKPIYEFVTVDRYYGVYTPPIDAFSAGVETHTFLTQHGEEQLFWSEVYIGLIEKKGKVFEGRARKEEGYERWKIFYGEDGVEKSFPAFKDISTPAFSFLCIEKDAIVDWVEYRGEELPDNAVNAGIINGKTHFVGRGILQNQTLPGMFIPAEGVIEILYNGTVHKLDTFEFLVATRNETRVKYLEKYDNKSLGLTVNITRSGEISAAWPHKLLPPTTYKSDQYCVATEIGGEDVKLGEGEVIALLCHPCTSQMLCSYIFQLFELFHTHTTPDMESFNKFRTKMEVFFGKMLDIIQEDGNTLLEVNNTVSITANTVKRLFWEFKHLFSEPQIVMNINYFAERLPYSVRIFPNSLISVVSGTFWTANDFEKDIRINFNEVQHYVKTMFYILDKNGDCLVDLEEFIFTLSFVSKGFPTEEWKALVSKLQQIRMLMDTNEDSIITLDELMTLKFTTEYTNEDHVNGILIEIAKEREFEYLDEKFEEMVIENVDNLQQFWKIVKEEAKHSLASDNCGLNDK